MHIAIMFILSGFITLFIGEFIGSRFGYRAGQRDLQAAMALAAQNENRARRIGDLAPKLEAMLPPPPATCYECGHLFDAKRAQRVLERGPNPHSIMGYGVRTMTYCPTCKKPYDEITRSSLGNQTYWKHVPETHVRVEKNGEPFAPRFVQPEEEPVALHHC